MKSKARAGKPKRANVSGKARAGKLAKPAVKAKASKQGAEKASSNGKSGHKASTNGKAAHVKALANGKAQADSKTLSKNGARLELSKNEKERIIKYLLVKPGKNVNLKKDFNPSAKLLDVDKQTAKEVLANNLEPLAELQDRLYAQNNYSMLIIFQALDAAGKDGTIKHVMSGVNPQGCQVHSFKKPSDEELDHDFLWRCSKALPERGRIGIFNRSYYEEVLIAKVHPEILAAQNMPPECVGKNIWKQRYEQINNFEKYLVQNGTIVLKFFLYVSKEEQKQRFLERINLERKNWKFSTSDALERGHWSEYIKAYEECFSNTSTPWAPWYVVPADSKPQTRLGVSVVITEALRNLKLKYPKVSAEHVKDLQKAKRMLESER